MKTGNMHKTESDRAFDYLSEGNYCLAIEAYQNLILNDSTIWSHYWYLGISLLLNGNEEQAQITWFEAIADAQSVQLESYTADLVKTLVEESERQQNQKNLQNAWLLRQYVRENSTEDIGNLLVLANICLDLERIDEAQENLMAILELIPNHAEAYFILGNIALQIGDLVSAENHFQNSIRANPDNPFPYVNLGAVYIQRGEFEFAEGFLNTALRIDTNIAEAYQNLGGVLVILARNDEAVICFQKAISIKSDYIEAYIGLISLLAQMKSHKLWREIIEEFESKFQNYEPIYVATELIYAHQLSGMHDIAASKFLNLESFILHQPEFTLREIQALYHQLHFALPHLRDDPAKNTSLMRKISKHYVDRLSQKPIVEMFPKKNERVSKPLRLGFISPNFRRHSVGWCAGDIICELAKITPHIFLYSTRKGLVDDRTTMFDRIAEKMYFPEKLAPTGTVDPDQYISQINNDNIDVLIDLDSVTGAPAHIQILKAQPAPVCLTWLGFDAPFVSEKNYYLGDYHTRPKGIEINYLEQFVRMPDSIVALSGFDIETFDRQTIRQQYELPSDQIAYLSVAPSSKMNRETVSAQIEILKQVPNSVLLCKCLGDSEVMKTTYEKICNELDVEIARIKYVGAQVPEEKHRTIYLAADVLLDSYPMNGGTYSLESLWFNLPIVTKVGEQFCSRMSYSFMQTLGISAGIAWNWEEYIHWGVMLGQNSNLRHQVQLQLQKSKLSDSLSPLWNPKKFAEDMYQILEELFTKSQLN
jgi:protein O-GlcNAc transferase